MSLCVQDGDVSSTEDDAAACQDAFERVTGDLAALVKDAKQAVPEAGQNFDDVKSTVRLPWQVCCVHMLSAWMLACF